MSTHGTSAVTLVEAFSNIFGGESNVAVSTDRERLCRSHLERFARETFGLVSWEGVGRGGANGGLSVVNCCCRYNREVES